MTKQCIPPPRRKCSIRSFFRGIKATVYFFATFAVIFVGCILIVYIVKYAVAPAVTHEQVCRSFIVKSIKHHYAEDARRADSIRLHQP